MYMWPESWLRKVDSKKTLLPNFILLFRKPVS